MMRAALALALTMVAMPANAAPATVTSPQALPPEHVRPRIFLGGSIDMGRAAGWQAELVKSLGDLDVLVGHGGRDPDRIAVRGQARQGGDEAAGAPLDRAVLLVGDGAAVRDQYEWRLLAHRG